MRNYLARLRRSRRGNVATMSALLAPAMLAAAALTVDQAALYNERRNVQRIVDLAAITAAANIDNASAAALAVLEDNGYRNIRLVSTRPSGPDELAVFPDAGWLTLTVGAYDANAALAAPQRFVLDLTRPNAVKVSFGRKGTRYFASALLGDPWMSATATASAEAKAAFSVGSRLLALDGGILNALLGGLTGSSLSLSVMDYNALIDADIDLLAFMDALATELDITAGTYQDVLDAEASIGDIAAAMAQVARAGSTEKSAIAAIATAASPTLMLELAQIVDLGDVASLGIGQPHAGLALTAGIMEILSASAAVANGEHQVALDLAAQVPGLAALTVALTIGEPPQSSPWLAVGDTGQIVRTAQTRLMIRARIGGTGVLSGISINLPIYLELATAEATLTGMSCPPTSQVTVNVRPGVADLRIAEVSAAQMADLDNTPTYSNASIVNAPLIKVQGQAHVGIGNTNRTGLTFNATDIANSAVKSASTTNFAGSLTQSLANDLALTVQIAGLDLGLSGLVRTAVATALTAAAPVVDQVIVNLLQALGIRLGEADVRVHGLVCKRPVLVQ